MPGTTTAGKSRRALLVPREWFRAWWWRRVPFAISVGLTAFALTIYMNTFIEDRPTAVFSFVNRLELDALESDGALRRPTAWLFGNEAWGLPGDLLTLADRAVAVPIYGRAESLNLAAAAAVCLYASARAHRMPPPPTIARPMPGG